MRTLPLARAFVVTVAITGCSSGAPRGNPPALERPPEPRPVTVVVESGPLGEPTTSASAPTPAPEPTAANAPPLERGSVTMHEGKCFWTAMTTCAAPAPCNPPAPQPIVCPAGVAESDLGQIQERRRDGICIRQEHAQVEPCPPSKICLPPPAPRRVEIACPDA